LQPVEYLQVAEKAANFIKDKLYDESSKRLHHSYRNGPAKAPGFLDDYAFLINGLLDLYEYGGKIEWLLWAVQLQVIQARETYLLNSLMLHFMSIASYFAIITNTPRMNFCWTKKEGPISTLPEKTLLSFCVLKKTMMVQNPLETRWQRLT
jgi:hypothetical protein